MRPIIMRRDRISPGVVLESDVEGAFVENNDPEINHFLRRLGRMSSYEEAIESIHNLFKKSETERVFAIVLNDEQKSIGHVGIHEINWKSRYANVGYSLFREY